MKKNYLILLLISFFVFTSSYATVRNVGPGQTYSTIQAAIEASNVDDEIHVYPGVYNTGTYIIVNKNGLKIMGVDGSGNLITSAVNVLATVGPLTGGEAEMTFHVIANNITISGIRVADQNNKAMTINGDNFTLTNCRFENEWDLSGAIYFYDATPGIKSETNKSIQQKFTITGNIIKGWGVAITDGTGCGWPASDRIISNNTFGLSSQYPGYDFYAIGFRSVNGSGWCNSPVGGAIITGNNFLDMGTRGYIYFDGNVPVTGLNFNDIMANNNFSKGAAMVFDPAGIPRIALPSDPLYNPVSRPNLVMLRNGIKYEINEGQSGDLVKVVSGTYIEGPQVVIDKNISVVGANKNTTIIKPSANTGSAGDARGWFLVNNGIDFNLSNVTLDGAGKQIFMAVLSHGTGIMNNNIVKNIFFSSYYGMGFMMYGGNFTISNNTIFNIGRIGMYCNGPGVTNGIFTGNTYTGKGIGNWLDYGIEIERGAVATCSYNTITNCKGVAASDGSTSAGMYLTTYFALGTTGIFNNNVVTDNFVGLEVGYDGTDQSIASAHNNSFSGNTYGILSSNPTVDAVNNWWGSATGPKCAGNPGGLGDSASAHITFDPWIGKTQPPADNNIAVTVTPSPIPLPNSGATIQFSHVGTNNVNPTVTIQKIIGIPGTPSSAGNPIPVYLQISAANLVNYTFVATIVLDVSGIPGFAENTEVMMSSNGTSWIGANGTYNASAHTYTFTTNHFSYMAFVNPVQDNTINLYVSTSTSSYSDAVYPNTGWNTPLSTGSGDAFNWTPLSSNHDWTYKHKTGTFYIIPVGSGSNPRSFFEAHINVAWNTNIVSGVTVTQGNIFPGGSFQTNIVGNTAQIDWASLDGNHTPDGQKYIAKLDFIYDNDTSGYSAISIQGATIYYDNGQSGWDEAAVVNQDMGGKFKLYLGDFASSTPSSQDVGDGLINGTDLIGFSNAYWSSYTNATLYRSKYDVGPTLPLRYYYGLPHPDGVINFEDLAVFSMGYSKTGSGTLPDNSKSIMFSLDKFERDANGTLRLPVKISGGVNDLRVFSMKIRHGSDIEYRGVETSGEMLEGTKFLIGKEESGSSLMDGASFDASGLSREGTIAYVIFTEKTAGEHSASIESVKARNSGNLDLEVSYAGMNNGAGIPKTFNLSQNYPNPFNPVTKIEYALPNDAKVTIKVYDMLGRELNVLVNEIKKAGYYSVDWNASSLSSGVYFYQMKADDFVAVKKMMLIK